MKHISCIEEKLDAILDILHTQGSAPLGIDEASEYLHLSKSRIYKMTSRREVAFFKTGKKLLFNRADLQRWVEEHRVASQTEVEREAGSRLATGGRQ